MKAEEREAGVKTEAVPMEGSGPAPLSSLQSPSRQSTLPGQRVFSFVQALEGWDPEDTSPIATRV